MTSVYKWHTGKCVYVRVCVCVCVSFQFLSFKLSSGCLFIPHHVNQGVIQNPTPQDGNLTETCQTRMVRCHRISEELGRTVQIQNVILRMIMGSMWMGQGVRVMGDLTVHTETGSQFLLYNRNSEEDTVQGGR